jgi:hypothetical protein
MDRRRYERQPARLRIGRLPGVGSLPTSPPMKVYQISGREGTPTDLPVVRTVMPGADEGPDLTAASRADVGYDGAIRLSSKVERVVTPVKPAVFDPIYKDLRRVEIATGGVEKRFYCFTNNGAAMSWHTSAVLIGIDRASNIVGFLEELGFPGAQYLDSVSFDEATAVADFDGSLALAVATIDGWTSIWGPFLTADQDALLRISKEGPILTLVLEGTTGTYGFEYYRGGSRVRERMEQEGEIHSEEGEPLAEELEVFRNSDDGERRILYLMEKLTIPFDRLSSVKYDVYQLPFE